MVEFVCYSEKKENHNQNDLIKKSCRVMPAFPLKLYTIDDMQELARDVGIERETDKLKEAADRIKFWMDYVLIKNFSSPQGWELQNMLTVASLIVKSSLIREESRGVHYRIYHPKRDDKNWKKHVVLEKGGIKFLK